MGLMCSQHGSKAENREMRSGRPEMTDAFKDPRKKVGFTQSSVKSLEEGSGVIWSGLLPIVLPLAPAGKDTGCLEARQLWQADVLLSSWFMTPSPGQAIEMKFPCQEAGQKELTFSSPKGARKKIRIFYFLWMVQILTGNIMLSPTKLTLRNHTFKFRQTNIKKKKKKTSYVYNFVLGLIRNCLWPLALISPAFPSWNWL